MRTRSDDSKVFDDEFWRRVRERATVISEIPAEAALSTSSVVSEVAPPSAPNHADMGVGHVALTIASVGVKMTPLRSKASREVLAAVTSLEMARERLYIAERRAVASAEAYANMSPSSEDRGLLSRVAYRCLQVILVSCEIVVTSRAMMTLDVTRMDSLFLSVLVGCSLSATAYMAGAVFGRARVIGLTPVDGALSAALAGTGAALVFALGLLTGNPLVREAAASRLLYTGIGFMAFILMFIASAYQYDPHMVDTIRARRRMNRAEWWLNITRRRVYRAVAHCNDAASRRQMLAERCVLEADALLSAAPITSDTAQHDPPWLAYERRLAVGVQLQAIVDEVQFAQNVIVNGRRGGAPEAVDGERLVETGQRTA